jgi:hypothetical protein
VAHIRPQLANMGMQKCQHPTHRLSSLTNRRMTHIRQQLANVGMQKCQHPTHRLSLMTGNLTG